MFSCITSFFFLSELRPHPQSVDQSSETRLKWMSLCSSCQYIKHEEAVMKNETSVPLLCVNLVLDRSHILPSFKSVILVPAPTWKLHFRTKDEQCCIKWGYFGSWLKTKGQSCVFYSYEHVPLSFRSVRGWSPAQNKLWIRFRVSRVPSNYPPRRGSSVNKRVIRGSLVDDDALT